jgi:leader peptidase (prepilin peptidase) / N-methyltransferase
MILSLTITLLLSLFIYFYYLPKVYSHYIVNFFVDCNISNVVSRKDSVLLLLLTFVIIGFLLLLNKLHVIYFLLIPICLSICYFDYKLYIIPDRFHVFSVVLITSVYFFDSSIFNYHIYEIVMVAFVLLFICLSRYIYKKIRKNEGLGFGDVKLLFWMSILIKSDILIVFFIATLFAVVVQVFKKITQKDSYKSFPFAPYLLLSLYMYYISV